MHPISTLFHNNSNVSQSSNNSTSCNTNKHKCSSNKTTEKEREDKVKLIFNIVNKHKIVPEGKIENSFYNWEKISEEIHPYGISLKYCQDIYFGSHTGSMPKLANQIHGVGRQQQECLIEKNKEIPLSTNRQLNAAQQAVVVNLEAESKLIEIQFTQNELNLFDDLMSQLQTTNIKLTENEKVLFTSLMSKLG